MEAEQKLTCINGIIVPVDWDEKGNVIGAAISCHGEVEYRIDNNTKGSELLSFIQEEVEATGIVGKKDDRKLIAVTEYQISKRVESLDEFFGLKAAHNGQPPGKIGEPLGG
jgi:5S rRNA maturation endonuclease (ribonuclease M5)